MATHYDPQSLWVLAGMVVLGLSSIVGGLGAWWHRVQRAAAVADWPQVAGEVRSAEIIVIPDSDGPDRFEPRIRYRYRAAGGWHEGDRLRVGARTDFAERIEAQLALQGYRPGERVTVYYDPDRPSRSVLEPVATPTGIRQWLLFGAFLLVSAGYCFATITWPSPFAHCPSQGHACPQPQDPRVAHLSPD
jgi:hypothetical protein